jgi:hypothetical protein
MADLHASERPPSDAPKNLPRDAVRMALGGGIEDH